MKDVEISGDKGIIYSWLSVVKGPLWEEGICELVNVSGQQMRYGKFMIKETFFPEERNQ